MSTLRIGVVGFSGQKFDVQEAIEIVIKAFDDVLVDHPEVIEFWVVSGLADLGIQALAYREAVKRGWKTYAVDCARSAKYTAFPVDDSMIIDSMVRGSESEAFLATIDVLIRIGGGEQSHAEAQAFKETGKLTYEYGLAAIAG